MIEWGADGDRSVEKVAFDVGVGVATLYREMIDGQGRRVGRVAAIGLAQQDLWPPSRAGQC